jgi:hypothetical protein
MDHDLYLIESAQKPISIADVADEEPDASIVSNLLLELVLLEFIPAEDGDSARIVMRQNRLYEPAAERAGAAGDQDRLALEKARHRNPLPIPISVALLGPDNQTRGVRREPTAIRRPA